MKKYTANYTYTNPNFVIQNLVTNQYNTDLLSTLYVTKNILQRGFPTTLSKYLQSQIGEIHKLENFKERFLFATNQTPIWNDTIKGDENKTFPPTKIEFEGEIIETHNPAKFFFEKLLPANLGEYSFIQSQILPEVYITEIAETEDEGFINQQVDFYFPQTKLVIEIDGSHHDLDPIVKKLDKERDEFLTKKGIRTIRITTKELGNSEYLNKIEQLKEHIQLPSFTKLLENYKISCEKIEENQMSKEEIETKLLPTAIIRFQILLIELLTHNYLTFDQDWNFNILIHEDLPSFAELATNDLLIWIDKLWQLKNKQELIKPKINISATNDNAQFQPNTKAINIDFSLFKRYTDENKISEDVIFVRTDYFDIVKDKNYFRVSTTEPVNYNVTDEDKPILEFFLDNIFDKPSFKEGQFPIISNTLNRKDTIGLLPTGGGKSLCYQLPCLLQPSINFVVCPIKSLMYDQNYNLVKTLVTNVNFITSDLGAEKRREIERNFEQGKYLFTWVSPEKFQIPSFRERISAIVANFSIAYAVVDEVHCLSEWGHDFRTSYLNLAKTIDKLSPKDENGEGVIKFIGLTATASVNVLKDIKIEFSRQKKKLEDENIKSLLDYSRKELQFEIINDKGNKSQRIRELLEDLKNTESFTENTEKAGLVFTPNVNGAYGCYSVANTLNTVFPNKVGWFSGDIPKRDVFDEKTGRKIGKEPVMNRDEFNKYKQKIQKDFNDNKYQLLVATKAFGMGIDKQNIFYTVHYGLPSSVESLYQEAGRAGRWDKKKVENQHKIGKCFVLHSPETHDKERVERLFNKNTTFSEMKKISDEVGLDGKDIFKQVFLFTQGKRDIEEDSTIMQYVVREYFISNSKKNIFYSKSQNDLFNLGIGTRLRNGTLVKFNEKKDDLIQKAIYRLSLLGIISDWTTDFNNHYSVQFNSTDGKNIIENLSNYITKYEPNTDIQLELNQNPQNTILEKSIWYLLNWTFENISYSRKQSLKTLSDFCINFKDSDDFKKRIDSYFEFSDTTFVLQQIGENPNDIDSWFNALNIYEHYNELDENGLKKKVKIYIPSIQDTEQRLREYETLRDKISRFLENNRNNIGLNFLSGFVRLALNDYSDSDGKERFESCLSSIKSNFVQEIQDEFLSRLKILGKHLTEEQKMELSQSIAKYFPELLEELAEYYDLAYLLNDVYSQKLQEFKKLNKKLYEQLAEI